MYKNLPLVAHVFVGEKEENKYFDIFNFQEVLLFWFYLMWPV